ncbi:hypothetical protein [Promicromonospora sp. NPDC050880]|uniref:hypothetical protein n=1 Tax=Promicromonospora sp. NPDC050880 TaxID=3364406 RepID=UPI0037B42270
MLLDIVPPVMVVVEVAERHQLPLMVVDDARCSIFNIRGIGVSTGERDGCGWRKVAS